LQSLACLMATSRRAAASAARGQDGGGRAWSGPFDEVGAASAALQASALTGARRRSCSHSGCGEDRRRWRPPRITAGGTHLAQRLHRR
jgi:hypothetical protein